MYKEFNVSCWNMDICDRSFSMRNGELGSYVMMENGLLSTQKMMVQPCPLTLVSVSFVDWTSIM